MFKGASEPLIEEEIPEDIPFHGVNGFGDISLGPLPDMSLIRNENAIDAIYRLVKMVYLYH